MGNNNQGRTREFKNKEDGSELKREFKNPYQGETPLQTQTHSRTLLSLLQVTTHRHCRTCLSHSQVRPKLFEGKNEG